MHTQHPCSPDVVKLPVAWRFDMPGREIHLLLASLPLLPPREPATTNHCSDRFRRSQPLVCLKMSTEFSLYTRQLPVHQQALDLERTQFITCCGATNAFTTLTSTVVATPSTRIEDILGDTPSGSHGKIGCRGSVGHSRSVPFLVCSERRQNRIRDGFGLLR